jgi:signal transduction histidine kinase
VPSPDAVALPGQPEALLRLLQATYRAVSRTLLLDDILETLADTLAEYLPLSAWWVDIFEEHPNGIALQARYEAGGLVDIRRGLFRPEPWMLATSAEASWQGQALPGMWVFQAPLVNQGLVLGWMRLLFDAPSVANYEAAEPGWRTRVAQWTCWVAEPFTMAVENARLFWKTQAQAGAEFLINQITTAIRQSLDKETLLGYAAQTIGKVLGVSRCVVTDEPHRAVYYLPGIAPLPDDARHFERAAYAFRLGQSAEPLTPFVLNSPEDCPARLMDDFQCLLSVGTQSVVVVPIFVHPHQLATLCVHQCDARRQWTETDLTVLRAAAEQLSVALTQADLFATLAQQKQELEDTLAALQTTQRQLFQSEKMAVLGQFVAGIAHEVNTPLGTVVSTQATLRTCLDRIERLWPGDEAAPPPTPLQTLLQTARELLGLSQLACERIDETVRGLRNFSRLDEGDLRPMDLHAGLESTLKLLASSLPVSLILEKHWDPQLPLVPAYPALLNQVFMNLVINAVHAMEHRLAATGAATPDMAPPRLTLRTVWLPAQGARAGQVRVEVLDNGRGIAPEQLPRIFDPGYTTKGVGVGTGLGLSLCYRIVEKHGGRIEVRSQPGQGTCFTVYLPV